MMIAPGILHSYHQARRLFTKNGVKPQVAASSAIAAASVATNEPAAASTSMTTPTCTPMTVASVAPLPGVHYKMCRASLNQDAPLMQLPDDVLVRRMHKRPPITNRTAQDHVHPQARRAQASAAFVPPSSSCRAASPQLPFQLHHPITRRCRRAAASVHVVSGRGAAGQGAPKAAGWRGQGTATSGFSTGQPPWTSHQEQHIKNAAFCDTAHAPWQGVIRRRLMMACTILFDRVVVMMAMLLCNTTNVSSSLHEIHAAVHQPHMRSTWVARQHASCVVDGAQIFTPSGRMRARISSPIFSTWLSSEAMAACFSLSSSASAALSSASTFCEASPCTL